MLKLRGSREETMFDEYMGWIETDPNKYLNVAYDDTYNETVVTAPPIGATRTWDGSENRSWTNVSNWATYTVPGVSNPVVVDGGDTPNWPQIISSVSNIESLTIGTVADANSYLGIELGGKIAVHNTTLGAAADSKGTLWMAGGYYVTGILQLGVDATSYGQVNLYDGVLQATTIQREAVDTGLINITQGRLVLTGDQLNKVSGWEANGNLVAYGGFGELVYDYDDRLAGMTVVSAISMDFNKDDAVDVEDLALFVSRWLAQP